MIRIGTTQRSGARTLCATIVMTALLSLSGISCGQSGPLFLPAAEPTAAVEEPAEDETSGNLAEDPAKTPAEDRPGPSDREDEKTP
jgi:predicted small lipoprotein YifL